MLCSFRTPYVHFVKKNVPCTFLAAFENPVNPHGIVYIYLPFIYTYILIVRSQKAEDKLESLTTTDAHHVVVVV